jgi:hypothetical protein
MIAYRVGVLMLFLAGATGGILGPIVTHLTWSLGMLLLLPPVVDGLSRRRISTPSSCGILPVPPKLLPTRGVLPKLAPVNTTT